MITSRMVLPQGSLANLTISGLHLFDLLNIWMVDGVTTLSRGRTGVLANFTIDIRSISAKEASQTH